MEQLRLQEDFDLQNAIKMSSREAARLPDIVNVQPEPGFRANIGAAGERAQERAVQNDSAEHKDDPQNRPGTSASQFRTNLLAEQLAGGEEHVDPEELARQEEILRQIQGSESKMVNNNYPY